MPAIHVDPSAAIGSEHRYARLAPKGDDRLALARVHPQYRTGYLINPEG